MTWLNVAATKALTAIKAAASAAIGIIFVAAISVGISALIEFVDNLIVTKKELK